MDNKFISVIIPIYNAEKYLEKAINSVLNQNDHDIQLVLVNDGSTDLSSSICDKYKLYSNVEIVNKENGGLSSARNAGIRVAKGKYILFLDADDYFDNSLLKKIKYNINLYQPDILDFGIKYVYDKREIGNLINGLPKNQVLNKEFIRKEILPVLLNLCPKNPNFIFDYVWNKCYKTEIIQNNNIYFDETRKIWEDRLFVINYLRFANTYYSLDDCLYNYVNVANSLSRRYSSEYFKVILDNYHNYKTWFLEEYDFSNDYFNNYWPNMYDTMIFTLLSFEDKRNEVIDLIKNSLANEEVKEWYQRRKKDSLFKLCVDYFIIRNIDISILFYIFKYRLKNNKVYYLIQCVRSLIVRATNKIMRMIKLK